MWIGTRIRIRIRIGIIRVRVRVRSALRIQRRVTTEVEAEIENKINEIRTRVSPIMQIRNRNQTRRVNIRVRTFDNHVARGVHVNARRVARVRFHEPNHHRDVVSNALKRHRNCAVGLEEINGTTVVVSKRRRFGLERRKRGCESDEVLTDEPLGVFGVRDGGGAALRENGVEELSHRRLDHSECLLLKGMALRVKLSIFFPNTFTLFVYI